ncbi:MAG: T9SS type A sorting domain-containing protein [Bacteroidales bacterium]|nr:T9SS type A sorting domain-containing protein [Bacteroidales bacterium]
MKKIFALLIVFAALSSSAQSIKLFYGDPLNNNDTIHVEVSVGEQNNIYIDYANISSETIFVKVRREDVFIPENDNATFCVGSSCSSYLSSEFELQPGDTITRMDLMAFHIVYESNTSGEYLGKYTFFNADNESDATSVFVHATAPTGLTSHQDQVAVFACPNPATDNVYISYNTVGSPNAYVVVKNLLGSEIYRQQVTGEGKIGFSVASLSPGIYFYGLEQAGRMTSVRKLLVK